MLLVVWFYRVPTMVETEYSSLGSQIAREFSKAIVLFAIILFPTLLWHVLDFADRTLQDNSGRKARIFSSHTVLVVTVGVAQITGVLIVAGMADWNSCDDLPNMVYPYSCRIGLEWWAHILFFGPLLFSLILCIGRAAITIRSWLTLAK